MNKELEIMDYADRKQKIVIENFDDVVKINVNIITGDEILSVLYKNYETKIFDSSDSRMSDFGDGEYCIYDITKNIDYIDKWNQRTSTYDFETDGGNNE